MITKRQSCEEFKSEYAKQLETTNADQRSHYHAHAPQLFQTLRVIDKTRVTRFADALRAETQARAELLPALQLAHERVLEAVGHVDPTPDWQIVIQRSKNGFVPPNDIPFEDAGGGTYVVGTGGGVGNGATLPPTTALPAKGSASDINNAMTTSVISSAPLHRSASSNSSVGGVSPNSDSGGGGGGGSAMMRRSVVGTMDRLAPEKPEKPEKNKGRRNTLMKIFKSSGR